METSTDDPSPAECPLGAPGARLRAPSGYPPVHLAGDHPAGRARPAPVPSCPGCTPASRPTPGSTAPPLQLLHAPPSALRSCTGPAWPGVWQAAGCLPRRPLRSRKPVRKRWPALALGCAAAGGCQGRRHERGGCCAASPPARSGRVRGPLRQRVSPPRCIETVLSASVR